MSYDMEQPDDKKFEFVNELMETAKNKGAITYQEISNHLENVEMDKNQMDDLYDALISMGIEIVSETDPDDFEIIAIEQEEEPEADALTEDGEVDL